MIGDFNIRDNDWDLTYPYHSVYSNVLMEVANSFDLKLSTPVYQVPTWYANNLNDSNSVIDLMFLWANSIEFDNYFILLDLHSSSDCASLIVDIFIKKEFIQDIQQKIIKNSKKEKEFVLNSRLL